MKMMRRGLSLLLALIMVVGLVPATVFAADSTATGSFSGTSTLVDATVIMSDLHIGTSGTSESAKLTRLENVLTQIQKDYSNVSSVNSAGDMFSSNESKVNGNVSTITDSVHKVFTDVPVNYVWTDHDRYAGVDVSSKVIEYKNYYIYLLSHADTKTDTRYNDSANYFYDESQVKADVAAFESAAAKMDKSKPLFVVAHQPLLDKRNDNGYAYLWAESINTVASSMDVVYFYGHNHNYDDAALYYYAKGSEMTVEGMSSTLKLNFAHVNAGYLYPSTKNTATRTGVALAVAIYNDKINLVTYGEQDEYTGTYALNVDIPRSHAKIPQSLSVTGKTDYQLGDSIKAPTVKVTYINGTTETLASGCTLTKITKATAARATQEYDVEGFTFQEAGNYELTYTATLDGYQAQATLAVSVAGDETEDPTEDTSIVPEFKDVTVTTTTSNTTTKTAYVLSSGNPSGNVLITNKNTAGSVNILINNNNSVGNLSSTVKYGDWDEDGDSEYYIELTDAQASKALWTVGSGYTFQNNGRYLRYSNRRLSISTTSSSWSYSSNRLQSSYYLRYNNGWTATSKRNQATKIYFYKSETVTKTEETSSTVTYSMRSEGVSLVYTESNKTGKINFCLQGDGQDLTNLPAGGSYSFTALTDNNICTIDNQGNLSFNGTLGDVLVRVAYTWTQDGETYQVYRDVWVEAKAPYFGIELHKLDLQEATGVTAANFASGTYYVFNETTGFYTKAETYAEDTTYYVAEFTTGEIITAPVALKGIEGGEVFAVWAVVMRYDGILDANGQDGEDLGDLEDNLLTWSVSDTTIADIDTATGVITFTGKNYGTFRVKVSYTGSDNKTVTDEIRISASKSEYVVPGDGTNDFPEYPNEGAVRFDKTSTAVGAFSQTGMAKIELSMTGVPFSQGVDVVVVIDTSSSMKRDKDGNDQSSYTSPNARYQIMRDSLKDMLNAFDGYDVDLAIVDFNGYSTSTSGSNSNNFIPGSNVVGNSTTDRTGANKGKIYTGDKSNTYILSTTLDATCFENTAAESFDATRINQIYNYFTSGSSGTNYDFGIESAYKLLAAKQAANGNETRQQFVIFLTDGAPFRYNGFTANNQDGRNEMDKLLSGDYADAAALKEAFSWMPDAVADMYNPVNGTHPHRMAEAIKGDPNKTYYVVESNATSVNGSYLKPYKGLGAKFYSIGFCIADDVYSNKNDIVKEATSYEVIRTLSSGAGYYWEDVESHTELAGVFTDIAVQIREAATNVRVEDKIGQNYIVNFSMPNGLNSDDTVGLEDFFIQVLNYKLDENNERIEDQYTVLENFTFDGTTGLLKSHTLAGSVCTNCNHVTVSNGTVTKVEGNYFTYEDKGEDGQFMNWHADRLTRDELVLQYFVYLEGSGGVSTEDAIEAGTYYTNQYATLTYTNYNGVEVQNEFPVPQMTWNGAQARYTFYLVNDKGQPVNRQGYVVPFADAVYVTDIFISSMTWNDLEQYESFEAALKAKDILPEVYNLYDHGASYVIHVFENEYGSNLNNHFVIGSSFTQEQVDAGQAAWTTYVFNNKSDRDKYKAPGYYAVNNEFWCVGEGSVQMTDGLPSNYTCYGDEIQLLISYDGKLTGFTENEWKELGQNEQYSIILINDADHKIPMDINNDGTIDGYYLYYQRADGSWYTIVNKTGDYTVPADFDFGNTAVAFAVVWTPGLKEDTVVVDFGLDVVIDVIANDVMIPGVVGLSSSPDDKVLDNHPYDYPDGLPVWSNQPIDLKIGNTIVGKAWIVEGDTAHVRVSLNKNTGMQLNQPIVFYYEANVQYYMDNELQNRYMYSKITVIPAATMYYEEEYVTLNTFTVTDEMEYVKVNQSDMVPGVTYYFLENGSYTSVLYLGVPESGKTYYEQVQKYDQISGITSESEGGWVTVGTASNAIQDADRPGFDKITDSYDANNIYGYDSSYQSFAGYSMGSAVKAHVESGKYAKAEFVFYGTGFDIISMTSSTSGTILVSVYDMDGNKVKYSMVDTYYGMNNDGTISLNNPDALYQIPVIKVDSLPHGKYRAEITVSYMDFMDHNQAATGYDFYLDAIRIYDPVAAGAQVGDGTIEDIYNKDQEGWPVYQELRNAVIAQSDFAGDKLNGVVFIDGMDQTASVSDYISYGPNNELYLAKGQAIVFNLNLQEYGDTVQSIHLGMKSADGKAVKYVIANTSAITDKDALTGAQTTTISTATDMYYDITALKDGSIVIYNAGDGVLSLGSIKATFTAAHDLDELLYVDYNAVVALLNNLQSAEGKLDSQNKTQQGNQFKVNYPSKVHSGESYVVQVTTRSSVTKVNDVTEFTTNSRGERIWNLVFTATTDETSETRKIVAYDQDGTEKEFSIEIVVVEAAGLILNLPVSVKQGEKYTVTVEANSSVAAIQIGNGEQNTNYTQSADGSKHIWTLTMTAGTTNGKETISVTAFDKNGIISAVATAQVNVQSFTPSVTVSCKNTVMEGQTLKVTVTTSSDVAAVEVNGVLVTTYRTNKRTQERTWTVELDVTAGDLTVNATAYDQDGRAFTDPAQAKTVTVNANPALMLSKIITDFVNSLRGWFGW